MGPDPSAPDLASTTRRLAWAPDSPALHGIDVDYDPRVAAAWLSATAPGPRWQAGTFRCVDPACRLLRGRSPV